ncbi:MAG: GTPase Era [Coriobacteriia bacterium]|nr:GTPase Era [Coriobacteriia bacterium]
MDDSRIDRDSEHTNAEFRSGFVALIGRPNAGKSTLLNTLLGEKIAITSNTPQTTRHRLSGIVNRDGLQIVFVDTPGLHKPYDALGEEVNRSALKAIGDVDVIAFLIDSSKPIGKGDKWIAELVSSAAKDTKKVLVFTKTDLVDTEQYTAQLERVNELGEFDNIIALSALEHRNIEEFLELLAQYLPIGPQWFPTDMKTDQSFEVMIAEFIREKVLLNTRDEVPHATGVVIDEIVQDLDADITRIYATIFVERDSQKGIVIGKAGSMIKRIGQTARKDLEVLLGTRVYLELRVKVKKDWRRDGAQIRRFGYGEGL